MCPSLSVMYYVQIATGFISSSKPSTFSDFWIDKGVIHHYQIDVVSSSNLEEEKSGKKKTNLRMCDRLMDLGAVDFWASGKRFVIITIFFKCIMDAFKIPFDTNLLLE